MKKGDSGGHKTAKSQQNTNLELVGLGVAMIGSLSAVFGTLASERIMKEDYHLPFYIQRYSKLYNSSRLSARKTNVRGVTAVVRHFALKVSRRKWSRA